MKSLGHVLVLVVLMAAVPLAVAQDAIIGEVVDSGPRTARAGYFVVLPPEGEGEARERGWLMETHMELSGRALGHDALAGFARRLIRLPEIAEAHVLNTRADQRDGADLVEFELAVVVETRP